MLDSSLLFSDDFIFNLLLSAKLLLHQITLSLFLCLFLLILDHVFKRAVLDVILLSLHVHVVLLIHFLFFEVINIAINFVIMSFLRVLNDLFLLLFECTVLRLSNSLLLSSLLFTFSTLSSYLIVPLTSLKNISGSLLGLIKLFPSLNRKPCLTVSILPSALPV